MNFKNPISTTREQSERLLALGVKPETADLCYNCYFVSIPLDVNHRGANLFKDKKFIPSWSLARLLEMMPTEIENDYCSAVLQITHPVIQYWCFSEEESYMMFNRTDIFDNAVECIGWLIGNGHFNKEFLIEQDNEL